MHQFSVSRKSVINFDFSNILAMMYFSADFFYCKTMCYMQWLGSATDHQEAPYAGAFFYALNIVPWDKSIVAIR